MLDEKGYLWQYLSQGQQSLIQEGFYLMEDIKSHVPIHPISDFSYLVFPFAKAYEGFLKQFFLDMGFIKKWQYESDHFRIGKALSPHLAKQLRRTSVYKQLVDHFGNSELADGLWRVWKQARNLVFHYFPHNFHAISLTEAESLIKATLEVMERAVMVGKVGRSN